MGLARLLPAREQRGDQYTETIRRLTERRRSGGASGYVTYDDILAVPWVWACLQLTAGILSTMPIDGYKLGSDGQKIPLPTPPKLLSAPSADVPLENWVFQNVEAMAMFGDSIGIITARDDRLWPTQIELVDPKCVNAVFNHQTRRIDWKIDNEPYPTEQIWHVPGRPKLGSPFGIGLLDYLSPTAGVGLAARKYTVDFFKDGAHPSAILRPETDPGEVGAQAIKDKFLAMIRGSREPIVLPKTTGYEQIQSNPTDAALVDVLKSNATDGAQFFLVPPELVGGATGDSMTYANVEARILDLLAFAVQFWMVKLEKALERSLPRGTYAKFNEAALVRTDLKTKVETIVASVAGGIMTQNEGRRKLELRDMPGGDTLKSLTPPPAAPVPAPITNNSFTLPPVTNNVDARSTTTVAEGAIVNNQGPTNVDARQTYEQGAMSLFADVDARQTNHLPETPAPVVNNTVVLPEAKPVTKTVHRNARGQIETVTEQ